MTPRSHLVLSADDLPLAELLAARLDGEVFGVGSGFASVAEIEQPQHRAASLGVANTRMIAEQRTAAWIWGVMPAPPTRHEFCSTLTERVAHQSSRFLTVREVVLDPDDVVTLAGRQVTTPLRTCLDLARFSAEFGRPERDMVRDLMSLAGVDLRDVTRHLNRRRNLPHKTIALARLTDCVAD